MYRRWPINLHKKHICRRLEWIEWISRSKGILSVITSFQPKGLGAAQRQGDGPLNTNPNRQYLRLPELRYYCTYFLVGYSISDGVVYLYMSQHSSTSYPCYCPGTGQHVFVAADAQERAASIVSLCEFLFIYFLHTSRNNNCTWDFPFICRRVFLLSSHGIRRLMMKEVYFFGLVALLSVAVQGQNDFVETHSIEQALAIIPQCAVSVSGLKNSYPSQKNVTDSRSNCASSQSSASCPAISQRYRV